MIRSYLSLGRNCLSGMFLALTLITSAQATPPTPPATVRIDDRAFEAARAGANVVLPLRIEVNQPARDIRVKVSVRRIEADKPEFERAAARVLFEQPLELRKGARVVEVPLKGLEPGEYDLDVFISGKSDGDSGFSDRDVRHLTVEKEGVVRIERMELLERRKEDQRWRDFRADLDKHAKSPRIRLLMGDTAQVPRQASESVRTFDVPPSRRLIVRPTGPGVDLRPYFVEHEDQSWTSHDPLTVRGRVVFQDVDGVWKPLVNVSINLWDEDTFGDEHLGTTVTDWDGRWSFSVNNDDGWLADGRDIYYTFWLSNTRLDLSKCSGDYRWKSAVHEDTSDGSVIDFGDETSDSDANALAVWSALNLAWNQAATAGGQDPGLISACFPASSTVTSREGVVNVAAADWDGDGMIHEYGHALMFKANGSDPSPGGAHNFGQCNQNQALSWSEGWATGFMLSVRPDNRYNWHFGDGGREIEAFSSGCKLGETSEGRVAAALLDMMDTHNDGNGGDENLGRNGYGDNNAGAPIGLASMYRDTMWGNSPNNDALQFWYSLIGEIDTSQRNPGQEVMYYNWMSVLAPDSCVATKVTTASLKDPEPVLAGLRRFRNLLLKPVPDGRNLINAYYRNSPEMALLLVRNPGYLEDSLRVLEHFGAMGDLIADNRRFREASERNDEIIPADVRKSIERLSELFVSRGGKGLSADARGAANVYATVKDMCLLDLQEKVGKLKQESADRPFIRLNPRQFTAESRKALEDPALREVRAKGLPAGPKRP
jgi:hypothetical protein